MTAIITLFVIAVFSLLAVRVATTALIMTGLSFDTASFQSYSAFFGTSLTHLKPQWLLDVLTSPLPRVPIM
jgi:hypothetical protein